MCDTCNWPSLALGCKASNCSTFIQTLFIRFYFPSRFTVDKVNSKIDLTHIMTTGKRLGDGLKFCGMKMCSSQPGQPKPQQMPDVSKLYEDVQKFKSK